MGGRFNHGDGFWLVTEPGPQSTAGDILSYHQVDGLARRVLGGLDVVAERARAYIDAADAMQDAAERLAVRDYGARALMALRVISETPAGRRMLQDLDRDCCGAGDLAAEIEQILQGLEILEESVAAEAGAGDLG